jgi:hypothetical protein
VKCGHWSINFLGHVFGAAGIALLPDRVTAIHAFPWPQIVEQLQKFLSLLSFYPRFVPAPAQILPPLTDALGGGPRSKALVSWTEKMEASFLAARESLTDTALLDHPAAAADLALVTNTLA